MESDACASWTFKVQFEQNSVTLFKDKRDLAIQNHNS